MSGQKPTPANAQNAAPASAQSGEETVEATTQEAEATGDAGLLAPAASASTDSEPGSPARRRPRFLRRSAAEITGDGALLALQPRQKFLT